jgi:hypothetical protein
VDQPAGSQVPVLDPAPDRHADDRVPLGAWITAAVFVAVMLAVSGRYGFMQDEMYFIVAGHHLAFGYVDQPPLAPLLTRITDIFGVNPTAVRILPALAGGATVVAAAKLAALFGAGRFGRVLAALCMACAPILPGSDHYGNTTPYYLLAWAVVLVCVSLALLRDKPRWWLGAGVAAGLGLEDDNLLSLLVLGLFIGLAATQYRDVLRTRWPWLGGVIALVIWAPNLIWQQTHGWPQLAMASALHTQNDSASDYIHAIPNVLAAPGVLVLPIAVAGFIRLWRRAELRFCAITATLIIVYVVAWVPGKIYYSSGIAPAVLAAGSVSAEGWIARGRRPRARRWLAAAAPLAGFILVLPLLLPVLPASDWSNTTLTKNNGTLANTIGWPQLVAAVVAQDKALTRAGEAPTSIFTGSYGEAAPLQVLGPGEHLPPVPILSGHNAYWMWGPGSASDRIVLVVWTREYIGKLSAAFASCRVLSTYYAPYHVQNNWTDLQIGVCTGPVASWTVLWPYLRHYD